MYAVLEMLNNMKTITIDGVEYNLTPVNKTTWTKQEIKSKTLEWGDISPRKMKWEQAKIWCEDQGGRLPTSAELLHAYEQKVEGFDTVHYWAGTPLLHTTDSGLAKCVFFHFGWVSSERKTSSYYVRCVRDVK